MIKVKYTRYRTGLDYRNKEKDFTDPGALADWIFGQMRQDCAAPSAMYFPMPEKVERAGCDGPVRIKSKPACDGETFLIHLIQDDDGIVFSDGMLTSGEKLWSVPVREWLTACDKRRQAPASGFAGDRHAATAGEDGKSTLLIHLDYGEGEHGYVLCRVPSDRLDEAVEAAAAAWAAYDGNGRRGRAEEAFEDAFRQAGLPFACEDYAIHRIIA